MRRHDALKPTRRCITFRLLRSRRTRCMVMTPRPMRPVWMGTSQNLSARGHCWRRFAPICRKLPALPLEEDGMHTPPCILIVDDQPMNVDILKTRLAVHGYETLTASDGDEALAIAA